MQWFLDNISPDLQGRGRLDQLQTVLRRASETLKPPQSEHCSEPGMWWGQDKSLLLIAEFAERNEPCIRGSPVILSYRQKAVEGGTEHNEKHLGLRIASDLSFEEQLIFSLPNAGLGAFEDALQRTVRIIWIEAAIAVESHNAGNSRTLADDAADQNAGGVVVSELRRGLQGTCFPDFRSPDAPKS